jgi:pyruvate formate lyase activating enzyme
MGMLAKYWQPKDNKKVQCMLCPHNCVIKEDKAGLCIIRKNVDGVLQQTAYGQICSSAMDPIEKKPLYHFYPGSKILSVGTNGCNMQCSYCQNWQISTRETNRMDTSPERLVTIAQENNSIGIAYTYNEPLVWYEFVLDCAKEFRKAGLKNVLVSNGQINPEPLAELAPYIDAANIDLKAFNPEFYKSESGDFQKTQ